MRRLLAALVAVLIFAPASDAGWPNSGRVYPALPLAASVNFRAGGTGVNCSSLASCFSSSRASNATMLDATGAVTYGPNNLIYQQRQYRRAVVRHEWKHIRANHHAAFRAADMPLSYLLSVSPNTNYIFTVPISGSGITSVLLRPLTTWLGGDRNEKHCRHGDADHAVYRVQQRVQYVDVF